MTPDDFSIPRIQLPQIGYPDPPSSPTPGSGQGQGTVRKADDHFERFQRFLDSGEGLDTLIDGVERDTVGSDGRTPDQRESEAEQAHQESVMRRSAVAAPERKKRPAGFFDDDDVDVVDEDSDRGTRNPPPVHHKSAPLSEVPAVTNTASDVGDAPAPPPWPSADDPDAGMSDVDDDADELADDDDDDGYPPATDASPGRDAVPPPGSLWDSTHDAPTTYDPGAVIVDPAPPRAEPGPIATWVRDQYRRIWVPLSALHKGLAAFVVVVLAVWGGYLTFGSSASTVPHVQKADPIVDAAPPPTGQSPAALPPDSVRAPACAARSQPPANAFSGKPEDAWVCVRAFDSDLQTVTITYSKPVVVTSIFVIPGFEHTDANGRNQWNEHRVVTVINWRVGGQPFTQTIDPNAHTGASIQIPNVATQVITGTIFKTVPPPSVEGDNGPSDQDINSTFAVKTITVNGFPAGGAPR